MLRRQSGDTNIAPYRPLYTSYYVTKLTVFMQRLLRDSIWQGDTRDELNV